MSTDAFRILTTLGLGEDHRVLDIGCGSLGLGSELISYLRPDRYFGVEPQQELIEDGVRFALGHDRFDEKRPQFVTSVDFAFHRFGVKFDYMMAHAVFSYIDASLIGECLRAAASNLKADGLFLASWAPGVSDHSGTGWNPHVEAKYTAGKLQWLAGEAGLEFKVLDVSHAEGHCWAALYLAGCRNVPMNDTCSNLALPPVTMGHAGYVEKARDIGGHLLVEGWAMDPETREPAEQVLVADRGGSIRARISVHVQRPDAAALLGAQALGSGFCRVIPNECLVDSGGLTYFAVTGNRAYRLSVT
jgi:SAM-dependent methyltransferase